MDPVKGAFHNSSNAQQAVNASAKSRRRASLFSFRDKYKDTISSTDAENVREKTFFSRAGEKMQHAYTAVIDYLRNLIDYVAGKGVGFFNAVWDFLTYPFKTDPKNQEIAQKRDEKEWRLTPETVVKRLQKLDAKQHKTEKQIEKDQQILQDIFQAVGEKRIEFMQQEKVRQLQENRKNAKKSWRGWGWNLAAAAGSAAVGAVRKVKPLTPLQAGETYLRGRGQGFVEERVEEYKFDIQQVLETMA